MTEATIRLLNQLNKDFYDQVGVSFSDTRQQPWDGWYRFLNTTQFTPLQPISVLDIGCGNGRLGKWLIDQQYRITYTGLDQSEVLLEDARRALPKGNFQSVDIVDRCLDDQKLHSEKFDVICLFGVLHHVPAEKLRGQLLQKFLAMLKPDGELWLSIWLPPKEWREKKQKHWTGISPVELEPNDAFLGWKESDAVRYVHWIELEEQRRLFELCEISSLQTWRGQEKGDEANKYFLLQK